MKINVETKKYTVSSLIALKQADMLKPDHEYQRAAVWSQLQKQLFIDSIMRGYSAPAFYFHEKTVAVAGKSSTMLYVIDGQQRTNAIYEFHEGAFELLDPKQDKHCQFFSFAETSDCPWAKKKFIDMDEEWRDFFKSQPLTVYEVNAPNNDEVRDLFIRLQGGTSLTYQDKRDAWPGNFTPFILSMGGKADLPKYPGHRFFTSIVKGKDSARRELAAQITMLFINRRKDMKFVDLKAQNIDGFYKTHVDFDEGGFYAQELKKVLNKIVEILPAGKKMMPNHEAIHLVLFVDMLMQHYAGNWDKSLLKALDEFRENCRIAKAKAKHGEITEYASEYTLWTGTSSNQASVIRRRHIFFTKKMSESMNLKQKDPQRGFSPADKEYIYLRDKGECLVCAMNDRQVGDRHVSFEDAEFHHIIPHSKGGRSIHSNGATVHSECHPKKDEDVEEFREWWEHKDKEEIPITNRKLSNLPDDTSCEFVYKGVPNSGVIKNGKLVVGSGEFNTFSEASFAITQTSRNGWDDWMLLLPGEYEWILAKEWKNKGGM